MKWVLIRGWIEECTIPDDICLNVFTVKQTSISKTYEFKFIIFTYTCLFTIFVTYLRLISLWIPHQKKEDTKHTIRHITMSQSALQLDYWQVTLLFRFNNHCYVQRIVRATSPQSMNVGGVVQKLQTISITQGQQY